MKLYYAPGACSLATHILLREAGLPFDLEKVDIRNKTTEHGEDWMALNPKGYVPALRLDDGYVLTENVVLHGYVASQKTDAKLIPAPGTTERLKLDELAIYITTEIHKNYAPIFDPTLSDDAKNVFRKKIVNRYGLIEKLLSDGRPYLTGQAFQTVDAYLFTVTNWAANTGVDLSSLPNVQAFHKRVAARPAVQAALVAEGLVKAA